MVDVCLIPEVKFELPGLTAYGQQVCSRRDTVWFALLREQAKILCFLLLSLSAIFSAVAGVVDVCLIAKVKFDLPALTAGVHQVMKQKDVDLIVIGLTLSL